MVLLGSQGGSLYIDQTRFCDLCERIEALYIAVLFIVRKSLIWINRRLAVLLLSAIVQEPQVKGEVAAVRRWRWVTSLSLPAATVCMRRHQK